MCLCFYTQLRTDIRLKSTLQKNEDTVHNHNTDNIGEKETESPCPTASELTAWPGRWHKEDQRKCWYTTSSLHTVVGKAHDRPTHWPINTQKTRVYTKLTVGNTDPLTQQHEGEYHWIPMPSKRGEDWLWTNVDFFFFFFFFSKGFSPKFFFFCRLSWISAVRRTFFGYTAFNPVSLWSLSHSFPPQWL